MIRRAVRLPERVNNSLEEMAAAEGMKFSTFVRKILTNVVDKNVEPSKFITRDEIEDLLTEIIDQRIKEALVSPLWEEMLAMGLEREGKNSREEFKRELKGMLDEYMQAAHGSFSKECFEAMKKKD